MYLFPRIVEPYPYASGSSRTRSFHPIAEMAGQRFSAEMACECTLA